MSRLSEKEEIEDRLKLNNDQKRLLYYKKVNNRFSFQKKQSDKDKPKTTRVFNNQFKNKAIFFEKDKVQKMLDKMSQMDPTPLLNSFKQVPCSFNQKLNKHTFDSKDEEKVSTVINQPIKLLPIKVIKPDITSHFPKEMVISINTNVKGPVILKKPIETSSTNRCKIIAVSKEIKKDKVTVSDIKNMKTKKKVIDPDKEVVVNIRMQRNSVTQRKKDNLSGTSTDVDVWKNSNYQNQNGTQSTFRMNQTGNAAQFALNNFDRFSDNFLAMRKTLGSFQSQKINSLSNHMKHSTDIIQKAFLDPEEECKYPTYYLPTPGKGLLLQTPN